MFSSSHYLQTIENYSPDFIEIKAFVMSVLLVNGAQIASEYLIDSTDFWPAYRLSIVPAIGGNFVM